MENNFIKIRKANENNLKNIDIDIPKNKLVIITGVSGSGKSSLAFGVLYSEGRRRYVDSLSNYARQFLGGTTKPDVESIDGLSPAIAINQKTTSNNPRSTVGTITEIYDFYRLLFARAGRAFCPTHNIEISSQTVTQILDKIFEWENNSKLQIFAPVIFSKRGTHKKLLEELKEKGFLRVKINDEIYRLDEEIELSQNKKHDISILIDRIVLNQENRSRLYEAIQAGTEYADGLIFVENTETKLGELFSKNLACKYGDFSMPKIEPRIFSFNSPEGACEKCNGLGFIQKVTWEKLVSLDKTIVEGGIKYFGDKMSGIDWNNFQELLKYYKIPLQKKLGSFSDVEKSIVMHGSREPIEYTLQMAKNRISKYDYIEGVSDLIERRFYDTSSDNAREYYNKFMGETTCDVCDGTRLNEKALAVKLMGVNINYLTKLSVEDAQVWMENLILTKNERKIVKLVIQEINARLKFLLNVGLGYLTFDRIARTLSGGESQRIRLASQLGSKLSGVIYVLDEPSIGLHQRDNAKLITTLKEIRDLGNTVVVVEHDEETMLEADYIIDVGPDAGEKGGQIVAKGTPSEMLEADTHTGNFLSGKDKIEIPKTRRKGSGNEVVIIGARENNLKNIDVTIPLNMLVVISGVSGSGKSTLINEILYKAIHNSISRLNDYNAPGEHDDIKGIANIDKVIRISQDPIGKTQRSNPATYTSVFDDIRDLFASTKEAQIRGFAKGRFSFNVKGGRCDKCQGDGVIKMSMHFLPDVYVTCEQCEGKKYNEETLQVKFKGKNIHDILDMYISDALVFFTNNPKIRTKLEYLNDVGMGYIKLGHPSTLLSGGEAQRVKLATYLQKRPTGRTLYILDEPTTGLHNKDIKQLLIVLNRIVDNGDSMIIIEHNMDVIKIADYVIDMGPEGGKNGGNIVAKGTPKQIAASKNSLTGMYLKYLLKK